MSENIVFCVATMDTKGAELRFVVDTLQKLGVTAIAVDVSTQGPPVVEPDVTRGQLAAVASAVLNQAIDPPWQISDRGRAIAEMSRVLETFLVQEHSQGLVAGVLGLGGSGGTALISPAMRALPIGLPKVMVSTVASSDVSRYVDCSDIMMLPSVVDIAGLNSVSKTILTNAARAMAGMVGSPESPVEEEAEQDSEVHQTVALTMFGVTTPCVTAVRQLLEGQGMECLTFHAVGTGGRTMENLVSSGLVQGVLDLTTTEVADEVVGGVFRAGPHRFQAMINSGVPFVLSVGALDMVNFRARETVPEQFRNRRLHVHNAQVTLMRTTPDENRLFARFMADRLNRGSAPWRILLPEKGISALDSPGQPFWDPEADEALFSELENLLKQTDQRRILRLPFHINDPQFADSCVQEYLSLIK